MKMRIFIVTALVMLFGLQSLVAQPRMRQSPEERVQNLKKELALADSQTVAIIKILKKSQEEMMAAREVAGDDRELMREAVRDIMEKTDKDIEKILDKGQKEKYDKMRQERTQQMRDRRPPM